MARGRYLIAAILCSLLATPALADRDGHGRGNGHGKHDKHDRHDRHDRQERRHGQGRPVVIHEHHYHSAPPPVIVERRVVPVAPRYVMAPVHREVIYNYFYAQPVAPVGLPPGIAKKIRKGHRLPPEVVYQPVPVALVQQVPACMNGWQCILAGADMLILDAVHGTVHDVIRNVVR
jgi:hypothetical protein